MADGFSLAANALGVVGAADVVFRSIQILHDLASRTITAKETGNLFLGVLTGLSQSIDAVRSWAAAYEQSLFATTDRQTVPESLIPMLAGCYKEVNKLILAVQSVNANTGGFWIWSSKLKFALWQENQLRQSLPVLQAYANNWILLIQCRAGYVVIFRLSSKLPCGC